jgi:zinc D-Ala-D-Ala carboxypeptidase
MISKHISMKEATRSATALRLGLDNTPTEEHLDNMKLLASKIFEPLRSWVGGPIRINSFYRGPELNKAIGGSTKSQHMIGQAVDIDDTYGYKTNAEMFNYIRGNLDFDQMIWEFGDNKNPDWVHVSYVNPGENRNKCLVAYRQDGKTQYSLYG